MSDFELFGSSTADLATVLGGKGRAQRVWSRVREGRDPFEEGALPSGARRELKSLCKPLPAAVKSRALSQDGTRKLLLTLTAGHAVETVVIPGRGRSTACISTQVGCARECIFCVTASMGAVRQLSPAEIVAQAVLALREVLHEGLPPLRNVVFMGMGEPLDNLEATLKAIDILVDPHALRIAPRHVTLSTVGTSPRAIRRLAGIPVRIAWSIHAVDDELRRRLVPTTRHPMIELREAFQDALEPRRAHLFVEVALVNGLNDSDECASALADFLEVLQPEVRINLLPANRGRAGVEPCSMVRAEAIRQLLRRRGFFCAVRQARGTDQAAACGQLAGVH